MNNKLKQLREKRGLSQAQVAQEIGISRQMYNKYERGDTEPSLSVIRSLCILYNVTYEELLTQSQSISASDQISYEESSDESLSVASPAVSYCVRKTVSPAFGTENYYAQIINLLPHLLLSEKSRLLSTIAQSISDEVEGRKSQPMKVNQNDVYFPTYEEFKDDFSKFIEFAKENHIKSNGVKWTREEMHER